jgi:hypothetical protein
MDDDFSWRFNYFAVNGLTVVNISLWIRKEFPDVGDPLRI